VEPEVAALDAAFPPAAWQQSSALARVGRPALPLPPRSGDDAPVAVREEDQAQFPSLGQFNVQLRSNKP